jgi:hypothetical protein
MKRIGMIVIIAAFAACRGEPVPRDYQNAPPAMTHPPQTQSETPTAHGGGQAPPQPSKGVEGPAGQHQPMEPSTTGATGTSSTSIENTPPVSTTT